MLLRLEANNASTLAELTEYKALYTRNFSRSPAERIMPTTLNLMNMRVTGHLPGGYRSSVIIPIRATDLQYQGPFAIADQVPLERPMPWDRKVT